MQRYKYRTGRSILALICFLFAAACTQKPDHIEFSDQTPNATVQDIYVTTGRLPSTQALNLKQDRVFETRFAQYGVSIPPNHEPGQIEWPDGPADANTDFTVVSQKDIADSRSFIDQLRRDPDDEVALFVHGYNTTPSEALYRFAQIVHDFEITTPRVLFSWPSSGRATGYIYDRGSVLFSRDPLADMLTDISRKTDKKISLMAHSMGAHLTMEVLRQLAITGRRDVLEDLQVVVLLAPDIDPDIFRAQAMAIGELPDPFVIMTSRGDRALKLSAFLNIGRQKVGDLSRAADVEDLNVTVFDFTSLADGSNRDHLVPMTSPAAIEVLRDLMKSDRRGQPDLSQFDVGADGIIRTR